MQARWGTQPLFECLFTPFTQFFVVAVLSNHAVRSDRSSQIVRECVATNKRILDADHRVIIVGGGPAGLSAAVYAARAEMQPLVVARDGGQLESTSSIDNCESLIERGHVLKS